MPDIIKFTHLPIVASEAGFNSLIRWPSFNGTKDEYFSAVESLSNKANGQLATLGIKESYVHENDLTEHDSNEITGFLHMIGSEFVPIKASDDTWNKLCEIDKNGRNPGIYYISYPDTYLIVV